MAGIIHGKLIPETFVNSYKDQTIRLRQETPIAFSSDPVPIKSIWVQAPSENVGGVHVGGAQVSFGNSPAIVKGSSKEFIFKHDAKESPGDLSDFYALFRHANDELEFLAITI